MKTYEEMAQSVIQRGNATRKQRAKTKKIFLGAASGLILCCLSVMVVSMLGAADPGIVPTTGVPGIDPPMPEMPMNYGTVNYLSLENKTGNGIGGQAFQYVTGTASPSLGSMPNEEPPEFQFMHGYIHVVAKVVEEYSGVYETLNEYGSTRTYPYRLFRMEVIDPLESGLEGEFFYLLPKNLQGDLTQYDALLISMTQLPKNFILRCDNQLIAFDYLFTDPCGEPELGNIIAFSDGIFDESLWQDRSWLYGYQFAQYDLEHDVGDLLVSRGSTLEEALRRRQAQIDERGEWAKHVQVEHFSFQTEEAQAAMAYLEPFVNGVFVPRHYGLIYGHYGPIYEDHLCYRYINGCPTNEWISIRYEDEAITTSQYRFEDADFENLPNISQYITSLDLSQIAPQHTDPAGKVLIYNSAVGWYEKTEDGVYSIVRIAWRYFDQEKSYLEYYDEMFILLDETGDHLISREELIERIGENRNIAYGEYGVEIPMPMC